MKRGETERKMGKRSDGRDKRGSHNSVQNWILLQFQFLFWLFSFVSFCLILLIYSFSACSVLTPPL